MMIFNALCLPVDTAMPNTRFYHIFMNMKSIKRLLKSQSMQMKLGVLHFTVRITSQNNNIECMKTNNIVFMLSVV